MNPKLSLAIGIVFISLSPILVKLADAPPIVSGFYRMSLAWVVLAPYCLLKVKLKVERRVLLLALICGIIFAADIAVWNISLTLISATISTLVANLAPVWVGLMSYIFFKKKSGLWFWVGTLIAIAGMAVLVGFANIIHLQFSWGLILALIASGLYAVYILMSKGVLQRVATLSFMFYSMLASSLFLFIISLVQHDSLFNYTPKTWACFASMGLVCQLAGWITINYAIMKLEATKVAISLLMQTVIAALLAVWLLHEKLLFNEIAGSVIVLAGIAITFLKKRELKKL